MLVVVTVFSEVYLEIGEVEAYFLNEVSCEQAHLWKVVKTNKQAFNQANRTVVRVRPCRACCVERRTSQSTSCHHIEKKSLKLSCFDKLSASTIILAMNNDRKSTMSHLRHAKIILSLNIYFILPICFIFLCSNTTKFNSLQMLHN